MLSPGSSAPGRCPRSPAGPCHLPLRSELAPIPAHRLAGRGQLPTSPKVRCPHAGQCRGKHAWALRGGGGDAVLLLFGCATKARRAPRPAPPSARRANSSPHPQLGEEEGLDPLFFLEHTSPSTLNHQASHLLRRPQRCGASPPQRGCCMAPREWRRALRPGVTALVGESPVGGEEGTPNPCELPGLSRRMLFHLGGCDGEPPAQTCV